MRSIVALALAVGVCAVTASSAAARTTYQEAYRCEGSATLSTSGGVQSLSGFVLCTVAGLSSDAGALRAAPIANSAFGTISMRGAGQVCANGVTGVGGLDGTLSLNNGFAADVRGPAAGVDDGPAIVHGAAAFVFPRSTSQRIGTGNPEPVPATFALTDTEPSDTSLSCSGSRTVTVDTAFEATTYSR